MRRRSLVRVPIVVALVLVAVAASVWTVARAEDPKPYVTIKDVMNGCNHQQWGLFGLIKTTMKQPECTPQDWKVIAARAAVMAEAGNALQRLDPPRGGEDDAGMARWKEHCKAYSEAAKSLKSAAAVKNMDDATKAVAALTERCDKCHADHQNE
jgi:hypothetical protein